MERTINFEIKIIAIRIAMGSFVGKENMPDIVTVIQMEGVNLKVRGNRYAGICPFHAERTPSFYVFPDSQQFHCFGCSEHGDVIDFIRKLYGLDFRGAIERLQIDCAPANRDDWRKRSDRKIRADRKRKYLDWEKKKCDELGTLVRCGYKVIGRINNLEELDQIGDLYHAIAVWEYQLNILIYGKKEDKWTFYKHERGA